MPPEQSMQNATNAPPAMIAISIFVSGLDGFFFFDDVVCMAIPSALCRVDGSARLYIAG
jgi:hypothetical protein